MSSHDLDRAERVELILQRLQKLPTLSMIATRLLHLTSSDRASIKEVVQIIESDISLSAKVLSLCRRADKGLGNRIQSVERAVVMIGFEAVRNAVLSLEVYSKFAPQEEERVGTTTPLNDESTDTVELSSSTTRTCSEATSEEGSNSTENLSIQTRFDRSEFWIHSIAVAVASQMLADYAKDRTKYPPSEAFVCGLLHDLGKVALDRILPRSYDRVIELSDDKSVNIAGIEANIIGLDHHAAGKRLAEQWDLPPILQDVMWLHGQRADTLPDLPHRHMIALVSLADYIVRSQHIGYSGNHVLSNATAETCLEVLGFDESAIDWTLRGLHDAVKERAEILGLGHFPTERLFLESIYKANQALGRINESLDIHATNAAIMDQSLKAVTAFHQTARPGESVVAVCGRIVASASNAFGKGMFAIAYPMKTSTRWQVVQLNHDGKILHNQVVDAPIENDLLHTLSDDVQISAGLIDMLPWLDEFLSDTNDIRNIKLLPLKCGWGLSAFMLHDCHVDTTGTQRTLIHALSESWASAIAAAGQHEGTRRLSEQLAASNRILAETQDKLAKAEALASLGELAAGAAHEMNNPLTVISGRSQVLAMQLDDERHKQMANQIVTQSHRLSDLITGLHFFADPPSPNRSEVEIEVLVGRLIKSTKERCPSSIPVSITIADSVPTVWIDPEHIGTALIELIVNALEAGPQHFVDIRVQIDHQSDRMVITVKDDGPGMDHNTLKHAFDPFFSQKDAGRQPGLGLARAHKLIEISGGSLNLTSAPGGGTTATITLTRCLNKKYKTRLETGTNAELVNTNVQRTTHNEAA